MARSRGKKPPRNMAAAAAAAAGAAAASSSAGGNNPRSDQVITFARSWLERLTSPDPHVREDGCDDIVALALDRTSIPAIFNSDVPATLINMLLADPVAHVRVAAVSALQNICSSGGDEAIDRIVAMAKPAELDGELPTPLPKALLDVLGVAFEGAKRCFEQQQEDEERQRNENPAAAQQQKQDGGGDNGEDDEDDDGEDGHHNAPVGLDLSPLRLLGELLGLSSVLCEGSDACASAFSHARPLLAALVEVIVDGRQTDLACAASELLFILSDGDSSGNGNSVAAFLADGLSDQQRDTVDGIISLRSQAAVGRSPSTLYTAVHLAGAFVSSFPQHAQRVVPLLHFVVRQQSVYAAAAQAMPVLASSFALQAGTSRETQLRAGPLRSLRAIYTAFVVAQELLGIAAEEAGAQQQQHHGQRGGDNDNEGGGEDEHGDDAAIRATSMYAQLGASGFVDASLAACGDVVSTPQDVMLRELLFAPSTSGHVLSLQASVQTAVSSILSFNASLLMIEFAGAADGESAAAARSGNQQKAPIIWESSMGGLEFRLQGLNTLRQQQAATAANNNNSNSNNNGGGLMNNAPRWWDGMQDQLYLQIESLVNIAWTLLRTCGGAVTPQPQQVQTLRSLFWDHASITPDTRVAITGSIGAIAVAATANNHAEALTACTEFLVQAIKVAVNQATDGGAGAADSVVDVAAEAANLLIDAFSDERFDAGVYKPCGVHAALAAFLPQLRPFARRKLPAGMGKRSPAAVRYRYLNAVATNLPAFLEYKVQNGAA